MSFTSPQRIVNAMTVDVEDYFHVSNFADIVRPEDWTGFEGARARLVMAINLTEGAASV